MEAIDRVKTISALSNWRLKLRREGEGVTILRAATCDRDAVLPDELFGLPVTRLSDRCLAPGAADVPGEELELTCGVPEGDFDNRRIRRLTLPGALKSVGDYAFLNLREMEELCLSDALQGVGGACFMNCRAFSRLDLTRSGDAQGPALAAIVSALPQELLVTVHGGAEGELRLVFPEYVERYEENSPARHFDFKIGGAGYPYHIVFRSRRLILSDYDALFPGMLAVEHEEDTALRLAYCRLRWPAELSERAAGTYRAYLEKHRADALRYAVGTRDAEGLRLALGLDGVSREELADALDAARAASFTEGAALLLERRHRLFPPRQKSWEL